jgi:hypothetical protein
VVEQVEKGVAYLDEQLGEQKLCLCLCLCLYVCLSVSVSVSVSICLSVYLTLCVQVTHCQRSLMPSHRKGTSCCKWQGTLWMRLCTTRSQRQQQSRRECQNEREDTERQRDAQTETERRRDSEETARMRKEEQREFSAAMLNTR